MDVQCDRCKTEYEFDDALVSGRGTTVKCTNCGFQFKVRPSASVPTNERWTVRTGGGVELVFTTLRELQRAITQRQVGRNDTLSRGNGPPRPLGSIAELEPFFRTSDAGRDGQGVSTNTGFPGPNGPGISPYAQTTAMQASSPEFSAAQQRSGTLRPPAQAGAPPPPTFAPAQLTPVASNAAPAPQYAPPQVTAPVAVPDRTLRAPAQGSIGQPPPMRVDMAMGGAENLPPATRPIRVQQNSYADYDTSEPLAPDPLYSIAPQRRRMGGWIVAVVLTAAVAVIGYKVGQPYLTSASKPTASATPLDPKTAKLLADGEQALTDGNLDTAKEDFDKASALQEKDPRVLLDAAKLAAVRADIPWLKLRLLAEADEDEMKATKQQLADLVPGLRRAADDAVAVAPEDAAAVRVKVDSLRIAGDGAAARPLVGKAGNASLPDMAYVLAALDLAEIAPLWNTVIDRLRAAANSEGNLGRARAALVYALVRAGDVTTAKAELDRLAALPRPHPLVSSLRAFVARGPGKTAGADGGPAAAASATAAASASARPGATTAVVDVNSLPHSGGGGSSDPRVLIEQAAEAENRGQLAQAAKLYEDALRYDGSSSEALAGLGTVSMRQGDPATARQYFARALAQNPNFMPALVGQADALWSEGDKNGATAKYKDIVERFPESGYPSYVKTRAAGSTSGAAPQAPANAAPPKPSSPAAPDKPGELTLPSNTPSDLPGATPP